jgi:hypothetical protein
MEWVGGTRIGRWNRSSGIKPAPFTLCPPQIPPGLGSNSGRHDENLTLKMEALRYSETSVNFNRQNGVTYQKCDIRISNPATSKMVVVFKKEIFEYRHNFVVQKSTTRETIPHFRLSGSERGVRSCWQRSLQVQRINYKKEKTCACSEFKDNTASIWIS